MSEILDLSDPDFTAQMQGLVEQAKQAMGEGRTSPTASRPGDQERSEEQDVQKQQQQRAPQTYQSLPQMLRPFVVGLEAITRATGENTQILAKLDKSSGDVAEPLRKLPDIVAELQMLVERKDALSKQMFDALHEELRSYKDDFLLETVHRPMIRDLITLYDDLAEIRRQMSAAVADHAEECYQPVVNRLKTIEVNIQHNLDFILEVLARLEVFQMPLGTGKLDKRTQRAVALEPTENVEEDLDIVRVVKRGFLWKERVVRPEEIIMKKRKDGSPVVLQNGK